MMRIKGRSEYEGMWKNDLREKSVGRHCISKGNECSF